MTIYGGMRSIRSLFGLPPTEGGGDSDTIRRIASELDRLEPERARFVAGFAFVLSRIAGVDQDVSPEETAAMERLVAERAGLPAPQAVLVVQMAKTQQLLLGGTDDFLVTRELSRMTSYDQKLALVDCLFAVAAADQEILAAEADEIAKIAHELHVEPPDLSRLRNQYRDYLAVRHGLGEGGS
jgi:uncharacterized tellurite resistance protein B-like protein